MNQTNTVNRSKVFITGASGLSGSLIVKEFAKQNVPVTVLVRSRIKARHLEKYANVEIIEGDMLRPETFKYALMGVCKALLISSAFDKLVATQQSFIDTAKEAGVPHVIKFSGAESGIGFNSQNFIGMRQHENIEDYLINSGLNWTLIRPSQFMQMYLPGAPTGVNLKENALILPIKKAMLSPVNIEDVAKVCFRLLTEDGHHGKIYEMTGPDAFDMEEACSIISDCIGRKISYRNISFSEYENMILNYKIPAARVHILLEISKERMKCTDSHIKLNTHKLFGIRPTNFAEFIYKNLAAFTV